MTHALVRTVRGLAASLCLTVGACGQPATAQSFRDFSDNLILYVRDGETDRPSIVIFDYDAAKANASSQLSVVALTLSFEDGAQPWDYRAAVDDRLGDLLKDTPAQLAVTHTEPQQRQRTYLLMTGAPDQVITALRPISPPAGVKITTQSLPAAALDQWQPTRMEVQGSKDDTVRQALAKHADDGTRPRTVDFFFYSGDQQGLRAAAKAAGFGVRKAEGDPDGSVLTLRTSVDAKTLNILNSRFIDWSDRFKTDYDGWETEVAKK